MENIVLKFSADISKLMPAIEALEKIGQIDKEAAQAFRQTNAEYQKRNAVLGETIKSTKDLTTAIAQPALKQHTEDLKNDTDQLKKNNDATVNLTKQLKDMQKELIAMEVAGQQNTQRFKDLTKQAGELKDSIGDARERIKAFASDTKRLDAVVQSFKLVAASASIVQGSIALFGEENKQLQQTLLKVQGAMAVLNGVQEVAAFVTGQSYLKTLLLDGAQKAAAISSAALGTTITATQAAMTFGLSAIAGGVLYLLTSFDSAGKKADETSKKFKEASDKLVEANLTIEQKIRVLRKTGLDRELEQLKVSKENELRELEKNYKKDVKLATFVLDEKERLRKAAEGGAIGGAAKTAKEIQKINEKEVKLIEGYNKQKEKINEYYQLQEAETRQSYADKYAAKTKEKGDKEVAMVKKTGLEIIKAQELTLIESQDLFAEITNGSSLINAIQKATKEFNITESQLMQEYYRSGIKDFFEFLKQRQKLVEEDAAKRKATEEQVLQQSQAIAQELGNWFIENTQQRLDKEFELKQQALDKEKEAVLSNQNLTENQRAAAERVFEEKRKVLMRENWKAQQQMAIGTAMINAALAVGNAIATTRPFMPAGLIAASGAAIMGAIQVAKIKSQPMPAFAEGTEFVEGAGTGTSDSITARLSRGERVVPAKTNKDYFDGLSVIQNRLVAPELVNTLLTNLAEHGGMLAAPNEIIGKLEKETGFDYEKMGKEFSKGRTQVNINLDEKGFTKHIVKGLNQSTYHNRKFRFKA